MSRAAGGAPVEPDARAEAARGDAARSAEGVRTVSAADLLGARRVLHIEHRGELYTLRITRNDRLILTK